MSLYSLPNEIIALLPLYIDNIETFTNASSSCRLLRDIFAKTHPSTILRLADASAPTFFSPHPYFLVAATARQASDWAIGNAERTTLLQQAFQGGIEGLYKFCLDHAGLTMDDIRRLHLSRFDIINPLSDKIDKMAGEQWYQTENFWDGGVSEAYTVYTQPDRATFQTIIYGELFGRGMEAFLTPRPNNLPFFDVETRIEFSKYIVPDWAQRPYEGFEVLPPGPVERGLIGAGPVADQGALEHIYTCKRWRRMWAGAMKMISGDEKDGVIEDYVEDEDWRTKLYRNVLQTQGLQGLQLVTMPEEKISRECLDNARRIREQIAMLKEPPESRTIGMKRPTAIPNALDPVREMYYCRRR